MVCYPFFYREKCSRFVKRNAREIGLYFLWPLKENHGNCVVCYLSFFFFFWLLLCYFHTLLVCSWQSCREIIPSVGQLELIDFKCQLLVVNFLVSGKKSFVVHVLLHLFQFAVQACDKATIEFRQVSYRFLFNRSMFGVL